jgi:hypothetical protein
VTRCPLCGHPLPHLCSPTEWGRAAWDQYEEAAGKHEHETGLSPHDARIRAEGEVRTWVACGGDAAIRALPPLTQGTGRCPLSARYERRPGSRGVARKGLAAR